MAKSTINLDKYLSDGIEALVKDAVRVTHYEPLKAFS
jgi:hypothetical protein